MSNNTGADQYNHLLIRLREQAEEAKKHREKEHVECPECGTELWKDNIESAVETTEQHDEKRHGGEPTTLINGILPPQFSEEEKQQIENRVEELRTQTSAEQEVNQ